MKMEHQLVSLAPEAGVEDDDPVPARLWQWCVRCGALKLGTEYFVPRREQRALNATPVRLAKGGGLIGTDVPVSCAPTGRM